MLVWLGLVLPFASVTGDISSSAYKNLDDEIYEYDDFDTDSDRCIQLDQPPETRYFYLNSNAEKMRILTSENPTQRLVSEVFRIFGSEVLGYSLSLTINRNHSTILDPTTQFSNISSCKLRFCGDQDAMPEQETVPSEMLTLGVMLPPSYHVDTWNLIDIGQLGPALRLGWFIPNRTSRIPNQVWDHWKTFTIRSSVERISLRRADLDFIRNNLVGADGRHFCKSGFCEGGIASTVNCPDLYSGCAVLVTDYPVESSLFTTEKILAQISEMRMHVIMVFVGENLERVLDQLEIRTQSYSGSYLLLSPHPSTYTTRYNFTQVKFPTCEDPLMMRDYEGTSCMYSPHRLAKVVWKYMENGAPSLFSFLESFSFNYTEFVDLLKMYNMMTRKDPNVSIRKIACQWLLHNISLPQDINYNEDVGPWFLKYSSKMNAKNRLYIGGIFPISGDRYRAPELTPVALMAVNHINNNNSILNKYSLTLDILDGRCEADVVMKKFIDVVKTKNVERFRSTAGVLGPACSDTVEPLAGVAKHFRTVVITYSAEGSISNENSEDYPYFFRTIAENKMYKYAYIKTLRKLGWYKIAALTMDGQKYSDHISQMQDEFQRDGITFISNRKFPKNTQDLGMYLKDLKERRARIIIGDFYEEAARLVMCEAFKQEMTQAQGYVWFLPGWFKESWYDTDQLKGKKSGNYETNFTSLEQDLDVGEGNGSSDESRLTGMKNAAYSPDLDGASGTGILPDCSTSQMKSALDGHLTLVHSNYAPDSQMMQTNETVGQWQERLDDALSRYKVQFEGTRNRSSGQGSRIPWPDWEPNMYSGYVYDAVWLYALALDKLIKQNKSYIQDLHSERSVNKFVEIIKDIDFHGVTGRINFKERNSRLSEIEVKQWHNSLNDTDAPYENLVGIYEPVYSSHADSENEWKEGKFLSWDHSVLVWKTADGSKPQDHAKECGILTGLATSLNSECQTTIYVVFGIAIGFAALGIIIVILAFKRRYDLKMRAQEDRMRALGLMEPMTMLALDEWEIPRDRVVINRKLGEGAFGTVFGGECFFEEKGWVAVAVKTLKVGSTKEVKIDFLSEAEMMKRFDHKNIVRLLGVCTNQEPVYTVMEYMLYGDLKTYLLARRHLVNERNREELDEVSNRRLTSMSLDIARGLAYLADLKYVHRDIACRNCLVNGSRTVKLADFGMTRATFESDYYKFQRRGMLPVRWMSPESLADGLFTPSSDVWSYGVLLYEIITFGSFPYQGLSNNQVLESVKSGNTLTVPSGLKLQLENLLRTCWRYEPTKRPTAAEIVELLGNNPRLVSPCIDVPLASVAIERTDSLELLPGSRVAGSANGSRKPSAIQVRKGRDPAMSQLVNQLSVSGQLRPSANLQSPAEDAGYGSGAYSPMHAAVNGSAVTASNGQPPYGAISEGFELREPLLHREAEHASSYVPPGYIFLDPATRSTDFPDYISDGLASI